MANLDKEGIEFLNRLYKDMYKSDEVMNGIDERFIGNKTDNIGRYIDRMQELHERVASSGRENDLRLLKEFYYRKYVIKEEDIPDSYYEHQKEIYLERGYGHVEFSKKDKHEMALQIISEQMKRLDVWIDYFISNDSSYIPMWAKYWAFQGMLSLGNYDKQNKTFGKRSKGTISPFVDLNREVLALSIDFLLKALRKEEIDDKQLEVLVHGGSFGKIYSYILTNVLSKNNSSKKSTDGRWVRYSCGTDHMHLVKSLQGYNTGWCTAGEATAKSQLSMGDFYVYYTYNEKGEAVVPRIAIRMKENQIAEVRGVAENQNLESEMEDVAETKLNEFPDKDKYKKKVNDMKKLTLIYRKFKSNEELKIEELKFIYEIENKIDGFGYQKDPRIKEILEKRNIRKDLNIIFNCSEEQVGIDKSDLSHQLVVYYGDLDFEVWENRKEIKLPKIFLGSLNFVGELESAKGLKLPETLYGDLYLSGLDSTKGLVLPKIIYGDLDLSSLKSAAGLKLPVILNGGLYLNSLESLDGLELPAEINGDLSLSGLESLDGLKLPETINGSLFLNSIRSANGLKLPEIINGCLVLNNLKSADGLKLPEAINCSLDMSFLEIATGLKLPKKINGFLDLRCLKSADGLSFPEIINGSLYLCSLKSADGLKLPEIINGSLYLSSLESLDGIIFPENFQFKIIYLAKNVEVTPENIHEYIDKPKSK